MKPGGNAVGGDPDGYSDAVIDGRYLYFSPHYDNVSGQDEVLRYGTEASFADPSSWAVFDPVGADVGSGVDGRFEGIFDGRYV